MGPLHARSFIYRKGYSDEITVTERRKIPNSDYGALGDLHLLCFHDE